MPDIIPDIEKLTRLFSKTPVIRKHPVMANIMQVIFFRVIFSLKNIKANINTKIGAVESNTAARDNGIVFIE